MKNEQVKQNDLHRRAMGTKNKHVKRAVMMMKQKKKGMIRYFRRTDDLC